MISISEAQWAETTPDGDEGARYYRVGKKLDCLTPKVTVTRITVQCDEPGLHGHMRRVCIWSGDTLHVEFPFIAAGAVGYSQ